MRHFLWHHFSNWQQSSQMPSNPKSNRRRHWATNGAKEWTALNHINVSNDCLCQRAKESNLMSIYGSSRFPTQLGLTLALTHSLTQRWLIELVSHLGTAIPLLRSPHWLSMSEHGFQCSPNGRSDRLLQTKREFKLFPTRDQTYKLNEIRFLQNFSEEFCHSGWRHWNRTDQR